MGQCYSAGFPFIFRLLVGILLVFSLNVVCYIFNN